MALVARFRQDPVLWLTGLASAVLLAFMTLRDAPRFAALSQGRSIPDADVNATPESLLALKTYLVTRPEAADVLRTMHLVPDMALPVILAVFLALLIYRLAQGATVYGRPAERLLGLFLVMPILYGLSDYSENGLSLALFPPADPSPATAAMLANSLFWATRLKMLALTVSAVIAIRLALARHKA